MIRSSIMRFMYRALRIESPMRGPQRLTDRDRSMILAIGLYLGSASSFGRALIYASNRDWTFAAIALVTTAIGIVLATDRLWRAM